MTRYQLVKEIIIPFEDQKHLQVDFSILGKRGACLEVKQAVLTVNQLAEVNQPSHNEVNQS